MTGRILLGLILFLAGISHCTKQAITEAASQGMPLASLAVPFSGAIAVAGGLSILLGYRAICRRGSEPDDRSLMIDSSEAAF